MRGRAGPGSVECMTHPPLTTSHWPAGTAAPRPGRLLLQTEGACDFDPEHLLDVFAAQRWRFVTVLRVFGAGDWAAPTRCAGWSVHEVVRHLGDCTAIGVATEPGDGTLDVAEGFDPRTTPREWLAASDGEPPGASLDRLVAATEELLSVTRDRLRRGRRFDVWLPYGPVDWTVRLLHGFWDSWLHERDVLLARGADHPTDGDATAYAAGYGVFIAGAVAAMFGDPVQATLRLGGDGGGTFDLGGRGATALTVDRTATVGSPAAEVADALAGRPPAAVLSGLPAGLFQMAEFFNTPA
jgi:uncharacterized protein (TIGR03083 family)